LRIFPKRIFFSSNKCFILVLSFNKILKINFSGQVEILFFKEYSGIFFLSKEGEKGANATVDYCCLIAISRIKFLVSLINWFDHTFFEASNFFLKINNSLFYGCLLMFSILYVISIFGLWVFRREGIIWCFLLFLRLFVEIFSLICFCSLGNDHFNLFFLLWEFIR